MFSQRNLRALYNARAPLSLWAQPSFAQLGACAFRATQFSRTIQLDSARSSSRWISSLKPRRLPQQLLSSSASRPASTPFSPNLRSGRRSFSADPRFHYQQNRYNYNRFGGGGRGGRGSLFYQLIQRAKPQHFVIIGVGISGIYLYNTDVVEVSRQYVLRRTFSFH